MVIYKKRTKSLVVIGIRIGLHGNLFHDEYKLHRRKNKFSKIGVSQHKDETPFFNIY